VISSGSQILTELRSVEGTSADQWPPSPALQSCTIQEIAPEQSAAFLVGMSGTSHWSASIEPVAGAGAFVFDVACRIQSVPQWMGNSYEMHALPPDKSVWIQSTAKGIAVRITGETDRSHSSAPLPSEFRVAAPDITATKWPTTVRWRYEIYIEG
jgi:hypothetical protein